MPAEAPDTPVCVTVQLKFAVDTLLVNAIEEALPEQIVCEDGVAVIVGIGFTVRVTDMAVPVQPFADGVMVYTAVPGVVLSAINV